MLEVEIDSLADIRKPILQYILLTYLKFFTFKDMSNQLISVLHVYQVLSTTLRVFFFYSEPFIYDEHQNRYVLTRLYKGKPFYIKYLPHAGAILAVRVIGGAIIYIIKRKSAQSIPEDNL